MHARPLSRLIEVLFWRAVRGGGRQLHIAMAGAAGIQGTFVLGTGDVTGTRSVH